ncbi:MAG TPA: hypothetical protein VK540_09985 [Polyangiaceae bacterium]|nr:hypothetical protein [Polyangiaceae bacterium]
MPSTVKGKPIMSGELSMPRIGAWHVDIDADAETLAGKLTLSFEGVELVGTVLGAGVSGGRLGARIVGGAGGISRDIGVKNYAGSAGTKISAVVADIMRETGETLSATSDQSVLGRTLAKWERIAGPASHALVNVLDTAGAVWRVLRDGTIWVGMATYPDATVEHVLIDEDWVNGILTIAPEKADLEPGVTFRGQKIDEVVHRLKPGSLRTEAHIDSVASTLNLFLGSIRRQVDLSRQYPGRVSKQNADGTLQVVPDDEKVKGAGLDRVTYYVGLPGSKVKVKAGQRVLLAFEAGDPARPYVAAWQGGAAIEVTIAGPTGLPAARQGDLVAITLTDQVITRLALMFLSSAPGSPTAPNAPLFQTLLATPIVAYGLIASGNALIRE